MGRLLRGIRDHLGPLARLASGDNGAPAARIPHQKATAFALPFSFCETSGVLLGDGVTGRDLIKGVRAGSFSCVGVAPCFSGLG